MGLVYKKTAKLLFPEIFHENVSTVCIKEDFCGSYIMIASPVKIDKVGKIGIISLLNDEIWIQIKL